MLYYPKMPGSQDCPQEKCVAFEKYDGTNLHWEWDRAEGWIAFGTRRDRCLTTPDGVAEFEAAHPELAGVRNLFFASTAHPLANLIRTTFPDCKKACCFTEFLGPNSFAGMHRKEDPKELVLFDVEIDGAFVPPDRFVEVFCKAHESGLKAARVVYQGKMTGKFTEDVRAGKYGVNEGVVCKGVKSPWMAKIKTYEYRERLKRFDPKNWQRFWE